MNDVIVVGTVTLLSAATPPKLLILDDALGWLPVGTRYAVSLIRLFGENAACHCFCMVSAVLTIFTSEKTRSTQAEEYNNVEQAGNT